MSSTNGTLRPAQVEDIRNQVRLVIEGSAGLSQRDAADAIGISQARFSQWLTGNYKGDNAEVARLALRWLDLRSARADVDAILPAEPDWYETPTALHILTRLQHAHTVGDIAVVYGAAGVGKTKTARHYAGLYSGVWIATMAPDCGRVQPALQELADALGLEQDGSPAHLRRAIARRLKAAGDVALLIIDEAQHLTIEALDEIRTLHDRTGCGIAYLGNEGLWAQMVNGGARGQKLDRVYSRVGSSYRSKGATKLDVAALSDRWGITDRAARELLAEIARRPGALRAATKVVRAAHLHSGGATPTAASLHEAMAHRGL